MGWEVGVNAIKDRDVGINGELCAMFPLVCIALCVGTIYQDSYRDLKVWKSRIIFLCHDKQDYKCFLVIRTRNM